MPYKQITQLPDSVKNNLPKHAQEIYKEAFNPAEEQYGEESRAHRVAWSAVEQVREERQGQLGPEVAPEHIGAVREPPSMRTKARGIRFHTESG